jgi:predicted phosphodiesterase
VLTAVVSDLHLGTRTGRDLLRRPAAREALLAGVRGADRLVLLGDLVELRESPVADALGASEPFFRELDEAFAGREVVVVAGNHDYQLASSLLDERRLDGRRPLGLEERAPAPDHGPLGRIAGWMPRAELVLAYPGLWLRDDVYAIHGHYMDVHGTVPTLERLAIAVVERLTGGLPADGLTPTDYEAVQEPLYSLIYSLAQAPGTSRLVGSSVSVELWQRLSSDGDGGSRASRLVAGGVLAGGVALLNRLGLGEFNPDLSGRELRRASLRAMGESLRRLGVEAEHVVFGHTHRAGPYPRDQAGPHPRDLAGPHDPGWEVEGTGTKLINSGSWIHEPAFVGGPDPKQSPYFPGVCVFVEDDGPPRLERLLDELPER